MPHNTDYVLPIFKSKLPGRRTSDDGHYAYSIALDTSGNVYVTGDTVSTDFPTTSGAYDTSLNGFTDVFVSKLNSGLTSLLASTYLGGSSHDYGYSLALDRSGNVYVTGSTGSRNFPKTSGAYDTSLDGWNDVFVSKLNSGLTSLLASTYLGGSDNDYGNALALDPSGNVYVTGWTWSTDFPTTSGAYDTSYNVGGGSYPPDTFVSKLNSGLTSLLASTYLGGSGYDVSCFLSLDTSGNVYVTGYTWSTDFPTTSGAYDSFNGGAYIDAFISKLNSGLTSLLASTYLGGSDDDVGYALVLDTSGNVYVTGYTWSTDFPTTSGAYDTSYNGGGVFVSQLDGDLSATVDTTPPTVASTSPGRNAVGVAVDSSVTAVFSEEMDASTINTSTFYLNGGMTGMVGYDASTNTATFTPFANLNIVTTYTATIANGVKDVAGNHLASDYTWSFTTVNALCAAESIAAAPARLSLKKRQITPIIITAVGAGDCPVKGAAVTAAIKGKDKRMIAVLPDNRKTDANGQAVFFINAKGNKGPAVIDFKASGLDKVLVVPVKVR